MDCEEFKLIRRPDIIRIDHCSLDEIDPEKSEAFYLSLNAGRKDVTDVFKAFPDI